MSRGLVGLSPAAGLALGGVALLIGCSEPSERVPEARIAHPGPRPIDRTGVSASPRVAGEGGVIAKGGGSYKVGSPYTVSGRWYVPREDPGYDRTGMASWYGADFHGRRTANGEIFDMNALTAAHPTLPLPSYAYVTNLANGRTVLVRINDRGPYVGDRMIDLSRQTARMLGSETQGTTQVRVRHAGMAPLDGNDARERQFLAAQPWSRNPMVAAASPPRAPALRGPPYANPGAQASGEPAWSFANHRAGLTGQRRGLGGPIE